MTPPIRPGMDPPGPASRRPHLVDLAVVHFCVHARTLPQEGLSDRTFLASAHMCEGLVWRRALGGRCEHLKSQACGTGRLVHPPRLSDLREPQFLLGPFMFAMSTK